MGRNFLRIFVFFYTGIFLILSCNFKDTETAEPQTNTFPEKKSIRVRAIQRTIQNMDAFLDLLLIADKSVSNMIVFMEKSRDLAYEGANKVYSKAEREKIITKLDEYSSSCFNILSNTVYRGVEVFYDPVIFCGSRIFSITLSMCSFKH